MFTFSDSVNRPRSGAGGSSARTTAVKAVWGPGVKLDSVERPFSLYPVPRHAHRKVPCLHCQISSPCRAESVLCTLTLNDSC
jgi:hypothetical protein